MKNINFLLLVFSLMTISILSESCNKEEMCTQKTWWEDADGDGLGDPNVFLTECFQPAGYVNNGDDPAPHVYLKYGDIHEGGIIFQIDGSGEHGKVCSNLNAGLFMWNEAMVECETYNGGGYNDWYLASIEELNLMFNRLHLNNMGNFLTFNGKKYWSSTTTDNISNTYFMKDFQIMTGTDFFGNEYYYGPTVPKPSTNKYQVCAVRAF